MYRIDWNLNIFMSSSLSPSKRYIVTLDYQTDQKYDKITKWEVGKGICWSQFVINISSRHAIFNILKFWNFPKNPSQCNVQYHSGLNDPNASFSKPIKLLNPELESVILNTITPIFATSFLAFAKLSPSPNSS